MPLSTLAVALASVGAKKSLPPVQLQFSTRVETTAHQLNATEDYPPYKRSFTVYIDFVVSGSLPMHALHTRTDGLLSGRLCICSGIGTRGRRPLQAGAETDSCLHRCSGPQITNRLRASATHAAKVICAPL
jgi:hypothetical protein